MRKIINGLINGKTQDDKLPPPFMVGVFCLVTLFVTLAFVFLLLRDLKAVKRLNPLEYDMGSPEAFVYKTELIEGKNRLIFEGYAAGSAETLVEVNNFIALYDSTDNIYLRLPTMKKTSTEAEEKYPKELRLSQSGYFAFIGEKQLKQPYSRYELCFAYRSNKANFLIHSGYFLPEDIVFDKNSSEDKVIAEWGND